MPEVLARDEGAARVLVLSNPSRRGAVDAAMLAQLEAEARRAARDGVRAVVLTGSERGSFCAGYDISALDRPDTPAAELPDAPLGRACAALEECDAPVIAAIDGAAFGAGVELACACDFRIAGPKARFSLPPARLGLVYSPEGAWRVLKTVGLQHARTMFLRAAQLDAAEALRIGLVEAIVDDPLEAALQRAAEVSQLAPRAVAGLKRTLQKLSTAPLRDADRVELEELRRVAFASADAREGRAAFLERRPPKWSGT